MYSAADAIAILRPEFGLRERRIAAFAASPAARAIPGDMRRAILLHVPDTRMRAADYIAEDARNYEEFNAKYGREIGYSRDILRDFPHVVPDADGRANLKFISGVLYSDTNIATRPIDDPYRIVWPGDLSIRNVQRYRQVLPCGLMLVNVFETSHVCLIDIATGQYLCLDKEYNTDREILDDYGDTEQVIPRSYFAFAFGRVLSHAIWPKLE